MRCTSPIQTTRYNAKYGQRRVGRGKAYCEARDDKIISRIDQVFGDGSGGIRKGLLGRLLRGSSDRGIVLHGWGIGEAKLE